MPSEKVTVVVDRRSWSYQLVGYKLRLAWQREMLLKIVAEEEAIIRPEDIHYYDVLPSIELKDAQCNPQNDANGTPIRAPLLAAYKGHGIDLAISQ